MTIRATPAPTPAEPAVGARPGLWLLLAAITVTGPLTLNIYLPVLPVVQEAFHATTATTQWTVSAAVLAFAVAAFAGGPLSDRYGRRPLLMAGLALQIVGSLLCWNASGIPLLIAGRVVQSIGTGITTTVVRAVLGDLYPRDRMVSALAYFTLLTMLGPFLAPLLGTWLVEVSGWRSLFVTLIAVAAALLFVTARVVGETRRDTAAAADARSVGRTTLTLLGQWRFVVRVLQMGVTYGIYLAFAAVMPYVMIAGFGRAPTEFALHFLIVGAGYFLGNLLVTRLITRHDTDRLLRAGQWLSLAGALAGVAVSLVRPEAPWPVFVAMAIMVTGHGLSVPNMVAGAISHSPAFAGTASSLLLAGQQAVGALFVQLGGLFPTDSTLPVMLLCAASSVIIVALDAHRPAATETEART